jgi:urea transport system permease protein
VIWVAVGGRGTLYGAVAGAVLVNCAKTYLTSSLPEVWLYALGALFVLVTLFLPRGIIGLVPERIGMKERLRAQTGKNLEVKKHELKRQDPSYRTADREL